MALRPRKFISSCFSGSSTDPVIRKSTTKVTAMTIASTDRQVVAEARLQVDEVGGEAADERRRVELAELANEPLAPLGKWRIRREDADRRSPPSSATASADVGDAAQVAGPRGDLARLAPALDSDHHRLVAEGREVGAEDVVDLARACRLRQDLGVDGGELDRGERDPERDQEDRGGRGDPPRDPHHQAREPVPEALGGRARVGLGAPLQEGRGEGVDAVAEQRQDRGQHDQRDRGGDQRDQRSAQPHRVEEPLREDQQRGERAGHGQRAEEDRAARRSPSSGASPTMPGPLRAISSR